MLDDQRFDFVAPVFFERAGDDKCFARERAAGGTGGFCLFNIKFHTRFSQLLDDALAFATVKKSVQ